MADLKQALKTLNRVAKNLYPRAVRNEAMERDIAKVRAEFKQSNRAMEESDDFPMMPERILAEVRTALPRDAIITTDVGWNKNGVGQQFPILTPGSFITPGGYATMGFGPSAAIGAKIAAPDRWWCRWLAMAVLVRTPLRSPRPQRKTWPWFGW